MHPAIPLLAALLAAPALGQAEMARDFAEDYSITTLGTPADVAPDLGGVCFLHDDPDTLLVAGRAGTPDGAIFAVPLVRGADGHVTGFAGPGELYAEAPGLNGGGVNGSLAYFFDGLLTYCTSPDDCLGFIPEGADAPDWVQDLSDLFQDATLGAHVVMPCGFPGSVSLKFATFDPGYWYEGEWFMQQGCGPGCIIAFPTSPIAPLDGGPRAIEYVKGSNPAFLGEDAILISKWSAGRVDGYRMDADGNPLVDTVFPFIVGLHGAEGMAIDPLTDDLIVSTSPSEHGAGNEIFLIRGFAPCSPADLNRDAVVDILDLLRVISAWGHCPGCQWCDGNLDCDCEVDVDDLLALLQDWGPCPPG